MRITNNIMAREALTGLQSQTMSLNDARRRVATGEMVSRPSDDPVAGIGILRSSSGLRALEQYRENLESGQARLAVEDSVLDQVTNSLIRATELASSQAGDTATTQTRVATQAEVDRLIEFVTDLANTTIAGSYIFGGQYSDTPPYTATLPDPTRPPSGNQPVEVGAGTVANTNHSAQEIFIDSDVVESLRALSDALGADDPAAIQASMTRLGSATDSVQELIGEVGGRQSYLDSAVSNMESLEVTLQTYRSELADADLAEAVTEMVSRQTALEAAMLANSKVLNLTLANYLR